uniref:Gypsy retrotransposon integrase-like protein 1 n=1 Tax=Nothobranchius furzeri TaxID=105023 RepID=A0A8C6K5V8_NOTFU
MLQRTREKGVRLNPEKCQICVPEVSYFDHTMSHEGIKPDPAKVKAIQEMLPPKNKAELETILGMVNYLARFAPHLSQIIAPRRQLLKRENEFTWDRQHEDAFTQMKHLITHHPVLAFFDPQKELRLQVDASKSGLGAVMLQDEKPVAYASKSLNSTEENYAQIEKELLFGCKRFHEYMYGRRVIVESNHKPLEAILHKPLAAVPPRLQRMILQLQRYDIHIIHRPGRDLPVADTLSRKSKQHHDNNITEGLEAQVHTVTRNLPVSSAKLQEIREATTQDTQLTTLRNITKSGWPHERRQCPLSIQEYWNHRHEIAEAGGIMLKGEKIIIPHSLRAEMIDRIHTGHMGTEKSKNRARDILFWPGMGKQIEASVTNCQICQERCNSNAREPLISHAIPGRPWQVVGTDLFTWNSHDFIILVDYHSRYFEMEQFTNCTSAAVISKCKASFARHGIPDTVISDNGPCYSSIEFCTFSEEWDFEHVTSSPHYPQSNGLAERTVQTAKRILDKAKAERKDHYLFLLEHRNAPVDNLGSPAQLLMSRRLRSILATTTKQLKSRIMRQEVVYGRRKACQCCQQMYYKRSARPLTHLPVSAPIRFQNEDGYCRMATVTKLANTQRCYHIPTGEGQLLRRNRRHLHENKEDPTITSTQNKHRSPKDTHKLLTSHNICLKTTHNNLIPSP